MAALSTYVGIALGGLVFFAGDLVHAQSLSGAGRTYSGARAKKTADPSEYFLVAFGLCQDAEKFAAEGNYVQAMNKGRQAEKVLATIVRDYPDWKPDMVRYRREKLAGQLAKYKQESANAPIPTGKQPGKTLPKVDGLGIPNLPETPVDSGQVIDPERVRLPNYDTTDKELYNTIARLKAECSRISQAYAELDAQYKNVQKELVASQLDMKMYKERYEKLQADITKERTAGNELVASYAQKLAETEERLRQSEKAREEAENRAAELSTQLAETQAELARVTKERDALKAENEQLRAIIELNNPEKTKALLDQNLTLGEQLNQARQRVADLEAAAAGATDENDVLNQQLNSARDEVEQLREQLTAIYDENRGYRRRVSDLTERLNDLEAAAAAQASRPTVDPALVEETEVLKDIIAKQRRTIEMQEEGRKMMLDTYKQLKDENTEMVALLQRLDDESKIDLTDAEKRLIDSIRHAEPGTENQAGAEAVRRSLSIEALTKQADNAFNKSRYTAAEQLYRTLYDYQPDHVPCLVNLGTILLYRNKCQEGIEYLSRATRLAPDLPLSYFLAGICYYRLDRMEEAEQMFIYTIDLDPANAEAFFYLANIEGISGRIDLSLSHFAAAVKLKPTLADAHYNMARLYAERGNIPDASRSYDRAVQAGAEPDIEFENYLRNHPDNAKQPGVDLVEQVQPEAEAQKLRGDTPAAPQPESPQPQTPDAPSQEGEPAASPQPTPEELEESRRQAVLAEIARLQAAGGVSAPTPSDAGRSATVDKSLFGTKTVRVKQGRRIKSLQLRLKRPQPQRLRKSGGDIELLTTKKEEPKHSKTTRRRR